MQEKMDIINRKTTRRFTISRFDQFNALDAKDLNPLPLYPYELCTWKRNVRVSESYRVEYLTNHYSVPYTHIHLKVDLKISNKAIHIFYEREKIAEHHLSSNTYQDFCLEEHMSPAHLAQKGLSKDEIEKMIRDAEVQKDKDGEKLQFVSKHNELEAQIHNLRKSGATDDVINPLANNLKSAKDIKDLEILEQDLVKAFEKQQSNQESANQNTANNTSDDDIVDAEVTEK